MKAFEFRLEPALRWRATQLRLEREAVSRAASRIAALQREIGMQHAGLRAGAAQLIPAGSAAFRTWDAYGDRTKRRIAALDSELRQASSALALQMKKMVEAHKKLRILENLKQEQHAVWTRQFNREMDAFADEVFLGRLVRRPR